MSCDLLMGCADSMSLEASTVTTGATKASLRNDKRVSAAANAVVGCLIGRRVLADGTQDRTV